MDTQIHGFDPNDFKPPPYIHENRSVQEIVTYCGVRFRAAMEAILKLPTDEGNRYLPVLRREMASLQVN
jgi:hypothetical protein